MSVYSLPPFEVKKEIPAYRVTIDAKKAHGFGVAGCARNGQEEVL